MYCIVRDFLKLSAVFVLIYILFVLMALCDPARSEPVIPLYKVIMAEAVSDGYDGMYGVACVLRNRDYNLKGFCGSRRKDLDAFCLRQGKKYIDMAKQIEDLIVNQNAPDVTFGATHFENIQKFGMPYWSKDMVVTVVIGEQTFFKKKEYA